MSIVLAAVAALLSLTDAQAPAAPVSPPAQPAAAQPPNAEKDPVICKVESPIGTRVPKKVCANKSVRDEASRLGREDAETVQRNSRGPFNTEPSPR